MVPLYSWPILIGAVSPETGWGSSSGTKIGPAVYSWRSDPQIPQESTSIRTSSAPTAPDSTSSTRMSFCPWYVAACIATYYYIQSQLNPYSRRLIDRRLGPYNPTAQLNALHTQSHDS